MSDKQPETVVAEVSANYVDGVPASRLVSLSFQDVIAHWRAKRYRLDSWHLSSSCGQTPDGRPIFNETIVAVFVALGKEYGRG